MYINFVSLSKNGLPVQRNRAPNTGTIALLFFNFKRIVPGFYISYCLIINEERILLCQLKKLRPARL
ncbi:MAG: hypothetical protein K0Q66_1772 [Chitinophagaceae bacterium]|jgi:hypothetical protein|nr:hypothetical protein [Chitinophagaceae bacterium]